ncbi:MAG: holin family protein [Pseudomonadota bacterium]
MVSPFKFLVELFGEGRNVVADTVGVFRENTEAGAQRTANFKQAALAQFAAEFQVARKGGFDRFMDGLNRLPRPLLVLAVFGLFASAMVDPIWFAQRMTALGLVPEPLWWLLGVVVSFYFGGRFQVKSQEFSRSLAQTAYVTPQVLENMSALEDLRPETSDSVAVADTGTDAGLTLAATNPDENPALSAWRDEASR